ncbi:hypothetical protein E0Z10_g2162 [Xylaria hypoxylon]|uniref:Dynamin N-terminal domain-containing protein n=1 Tax=Xylaria hypoxylon TaxID=37992 RepID=A0A4Z0YRM8_9PEZI|nr:hypothetical protein E0Z10_g2162 [Xylaria hypoxylon]
MEEEEININVKVEPSLDHQMTTTSENMKTLPWTECSEADAYKRLSIKEQSLDIALDYCEQLINKIEDVFANIKKHSEESAELIWPLEDREEWISQCQDIIKEHKDFNILVGVAGATGSGKTSALNALLGFQELLPTNNEEAATAVQCKVAFNDETRPEYAFRCHVTFQSKEALEIKIRQFFNDLKVRDELQESHRGSLEDEQALRELESVLQPTREMVNIVFGLQDDQVQDLGLEGVLKSNPEALQLLGTVKKFNSSNVDAISKQMKPYMDSTTADHSTSGECFAAWPLIEQVELFIKSDILRNGVVLVDLPGLGDAVESRALVAERSFNQLTATLIVAQATRAADNSTAVDLMSKNQEMAMMMDGKFHKETFCVCLSQIDQIDRKAALRKPDAKANLDLQNLLKEEESHKFTLKTKLQERKRRKKLMKKLRMAMRKPRKSGKEIAAKAVMYKLKGEKRGQKLVLAKICQQITSSKRNLIEADGKITFTCIRARNQYLRDRIGLDFKKRQARLDAKTGTRESAYDGQVAVCPTSARAFWNCKSTIKRVTGFPSEEYTGIPGLASWIRSATIPKREEHVDELLSRLQAQFNIIQLWSEDRSKLSDLLVTKDSFEKDVLADVLKTTEHNLSVYWSQLATKVTELNPFHNEEEVLSDCPELCRKTVIGWAYRKPDNKASNDKLHWTTYHASLSRLGGKFVSKSKGILQEYNWMQDISRILYDVIVKDWDQSFNKDVPFLINDARPMIDTIWDGFIENLNSSIEETEPRLLSYFMNEKHRLDTIKRNTKIKVKAALRHVTERASQSHPLILGKIQLGWQEAFQAALGIRGQSSIHSTMVYDTDSVIGNGSYTARQQLLLCFAADQSGKVFIAAYKDLEHRLKDNFNQLPKELDTISQFVVRELRRIVGLSLDKVLKPTSDLALKLEVVAEEKKRLQLCVQTAPLKWTLESGFLSPGNCEIDSKTEQGLPEEYRHSQTELERLEDDDGESDSESHTDAYSDDSSSDDDDDDADPGVALRDDDGEDMKMEY